MRQKRNIALMLAGLFLMNLFAVHTLSAWSFISGEDISLVIPFCKKSNAANSENDFEFSSVAIDQTVEITAVCTTVFDFKSPALTFFFVSDNFKECNFSDSLHLNVFLDQHLLPPQV